MKHIVAYASTPTLCSGNELKGHCNKEAVCLIFLAGKKETIGYGLCQEHLDWLNKIHQVVIQTYET